MRSDGLCLIEKIKYLLCPTEKSPCVIHNATIHCNDMSPFRGQRSGIRGEGARVEIYAPGTDMENRPNDFMGISKR